MTRNQRRPKQTKPRKMKSLEFFKPTLATTLAIVLAWLLSVRPAQAGYTVTLQQVGPDVVATGSGAINLHGLTFIQSTSLDPAIRPTAFLHPFALHFHRADFFQHRPVRRPQWTDEFRAQWLGNVCQQWQRRHGRDKHDRLARNRRSLCQSQCSNGLCLRYRSIGQRDLQRHDSCRT